MNVYYVSLDPFCQVVKYENGSISIDSTYKGKVLNKMEFIGELLTKEKMDYFQECIPLAERIELLLRGHSPLGHGIEKSLSSAML
ncbi:hypothetical protein [Alkalihalobacillus deserti]|uniref:hypothetical protein n=1 Tax=Alkalihalobacillus deserti TaxID=2879466 RepID=UPI001D15B1D6|nr:hypothetical protein [Alkalihalobacillus deserti]